MVSRGSTKSVSPTLISSFFPWTVRTTRDAARGAAILRDAAATLCDRTSERPFPAALTEVTDNEIVGASTGLELSSLAYVVALLVWSLWPAARGVRASGTRLSGAAVAVKTKRVLGVGAKLEPASLCRRDSGDCAVRPHWQVVDRKQRKLQPCRHAGLVEDRVM